MELTELKIAIIGLGYVGLPLAVEFGKKSSVIGFDINHSRIDELKRGEDHTLEVSSDDLKKADQLNFSANLHDLKEANFFIVTVPTPVDQVNRPDLTPLKKASETVGQALKKGDIVVYESTVYPGVTDDVCGPLIEKITGKVRGVDFKLGYSPERINPGDKEHRLENIIKIVSGEDAETLEAVAQLYSVVVEVGVYKASSIKVAEAAKVIENTQRDVNIALINELALIFHRLGIDTREVLNAAGTKWNFLKFSPGLVGGHCIGVDPYYLTYKASELGFNSRVITAGRYVNDTMGNYISKKILQHIIQHAGNVKESKVLIMGTTFKENVSDIRNSKVADIVNVLQSYYINIHIVDPYASSEELKHEYGFELTSEAGNDYDVVILAVPHTEYKKLDENYFASITKPHGLIADIKGLYRNKITNRHYWSL